MGEGKSERNLQLRIIGFIHVFVHNLRCIYECTVTHLCVLLMSTAYKS